MKYYQDNPQSESKPQGMVVIPTKSTIEDSKFVKLPTQELPIFSGDYASWSSFIDTFDSMVGKKDNISDTAKLSYLKASVRGDAKTIINRLETNSTGNYDRARKLLTDRYDNPRSIIRAHIDYIVNCPVVKQDNGPLLRRYLEKLEDNIEGLRQLQVSTDEWGPILIFHIYQKLDNDTRRDFEIKHPGTAIQKVPALLKFLKERALALETYSATGKKPVSADAPKAVPKEHKGGVFTGQAGGSLQAPTKCFVCDHSHSPFKCEELLAMTVEQRQKLVKDLDVCGNCLRTTHTTPNCRSRYTCKTCSKRHHSLLHVVKPGGRGGKGHLGAALHVTKSAHDADSTSSPQVNTVSGTQSQQTTTTTTQSPQPQVSAAHDTSVAVGTQSVAGGSRQLAATTGKVQHGDGVSGAGFQVKNQEFVTSLLGTARLPILNKEGDIVYGRALLDSGSQLNFVTDKFASKCGLEKQDSKCTIHTIGAVHPSATVGSVNFELSLPNGNRLPVFAHVLTRVTGVLPSQKIDVSQDDYSLDWEDLADSSFTEPGEIDLLIGVEVYEQLMLGIKKRIGTLTATKSQVGWVITGTAQVSQQAEGDDDLEDSFIVGHAALVDKDILSFWEVNDIKDTSVLAKDPELYTTEELFVHTHFDCTTKVGDDGRFAVSLPFKENDAGVPTLELGYSRAPAVRMLEGMEKKFIKNPHFARQYSDFVHEFIDLGHLVLVDEREVNKLPNAEKYYLPHHAVEKDSTTTKLRVVMNASSRSSTGVTLNDKIAVGPPLQDQLICHLLRYRFHRVALSGDISKMYRQILLNLKDRKYHLFLWRDSPDEPIRCYEMTRVTYGVASSCYHAVRALQEAARKSGLGPEVVSAALRDFYVDDVMTGAATVHEAQQLMADLIQLMRESQLLIRKWASNEPSIIAALPEALRENSDAFDISAPEHEEHSLKTLGIRWQPATDVFGFTVSHVELEYELLHRITKRELLGDILKIFDPMGWLSPVTLKLKIFMQFTWSQGLSWDEPLPADVRDNFLQWRTNLPSLRSLKIPRCILAPGKTAKLQFHVFCDASQLGYAACIYTRVQDEDGQVSVNLLFAKAKVAPVKALSIPRLELMAAVLGTKILTIVQASVASLRLEPDDVFCYSDSTTVLAWLAKPSKTWSTFVQNRVSDIQSVVQRNRWYHVRTEENPADVASRGVFPEHLAGNNLWWYGPPWLSSGEFEVPDQSHLIHSTSEEMKKDPQHASLSTLVRISPLKCFRISRAPATLSAMSE